MISKLFFCWITTCTLKNPAYVYCQNQIWQLFHCIFVKLNLFCKTQWAKTQKKWQFWEQMFSKARVAEPEGKPEWRKLKYSFDFCLRGNQVSSPDTHFKFQSFGVLAQCALQSCKKDRTRNFICVQLESNYPIVH